MNEQPQTISLADFSRALSLATRWGPAKIQFLGTIGAVTVLYVFVAIGSCFLQDDTTALTLLSTALGIVAAYPLLAASILVSTIVQRDDSPLAIWSLFDSLRVRIVRVIACSAVVAAACVLVTVAPIILISIGNVGEVGELLYSAFLIPLLILTLAQLLVLFAGLFVLPQFLADEEGSLREALRRLKETVALGWRDLLLRHALAIVCSCLLALPFMLAIDAAVGILGALTAAIKSAPLETREAPPLLLAIAAGQLSDFSPVWLRFQTFAQFLAGLAGVFALSIPLTVAILYQSATGGLALKAIELEDEDADYSEPDAEPETEPEADDGSDGDSDDDLGDEDE